MNILAIEKCPTLMRGGQERSYFDILSELKRRGHCIDLAYSEQGDLLNEYERLGVQTFKIDETHLTHDRLRSGFGIIKSVIKLINRHVDVVYINQVDDLPLAALVKLANKSRLVCHLRVPPPNPATILTSRLKQLGVATRLVDQFIVASNRSRQNYAKSGIEEQRIKVIPNAFDFGRLIPIRNKASNPIFQIAYIGRIDRQKGIHDLIDGFQRLSAKFPTFRLNIAGAPTRADQHQYFEELKSQVSSCNLCNKVNFVGHVSSPSSFLSLQDLCVFPSTTEESFGRVLVESLMAGTPVISRDVGITREIINDPDGEWVFSTIDELVLTVERFITNPLKYGLESRIQNILSKYDMKQVIIDVENVLCPIG